MDQTLLLATMKIIKLNTYQAAPFNDLERHTTKYVPENDNVDHDEDSEYETGRFHQPAQSTIRRRCQQ